MSEHYDTQQKCPECGLFHDTDDEWCDGLAALTCSAWKPINDDALDGQMRILSDGGRVMTGAWEPNNAGGFSWFSEDSKILPMQPTHWMPLPEPPTEDE